MLDIFSSALVSAQELKRSNNVNWDDGTVLPHEYFKLNLKEKTYLV